MASLEDAEVVISSSDDEESGELHLTASHHPTQGDIGKLVVQAQQLLREADRKSSPEDNLNPYERYGISGSVTPQDLFRDSVLTELMETVLRLRTRLSAERIFNEGPPQHPEEREIFDGLLLRFSTDLLDSARSRLSTSDADHISWTASRSYSAQNHRAEEGVLVLRSESDNSHIPGPSSVVSVETAPATGAALSAPNSLDDTNRAGPSEAVLHHSQDKRSLAESSVCEEKKNVAQHKCFIKHLLSHSQFQHLQEEDAELQQIVLSALSKLETKVFTEQKKKRSMESSEVDASGPSPKKKKLEDKNAVCAEDEEESCPICFEPWSTGGEHRVSCLTCGHLFGLKCIERWVSQAHSCPQCKAPAKKRDIRSIFVTRVTAADTSERDRALRLLEEEVTMRRGLEHKEAVARKKLHIQTAENDELKVRLSLLESQVSHQSRDDPSSSGAASGNCHGRDTSSLSSSSKSFKPCQNISISQDGTCRVFDFSQELGMAVISQKSQNPIFKGFGIKVLSRDFRPLSYQPLHVGAIRDMSFRPDTYDGMLLSCGMDKSVQLTSVMSKCVVQKYTLNMNVWCCTWNTSNTNLFYAGMERGVVKEFDIRRTDSPVQDLLESGGSPINSLQYWGGSGENSFKGVLIAQMQNLLFKEQTEEGYRTNLLPHLPASLMHLSLHSSGKFLASNRPGSSVPKCQYEICHLMKEETNLENNGITSKRLSSWEGGHLQAVISRNALLSRPETEDGLIAATANHSTSTVKLWDLASRREFQSLNVGDKAIDIKALSTSSTSELLAVLTDKDFLLYKWS